MGIFKKSKAIYVERMDLLSGVTVTDDKVHFSLNYSGIDLNAEDIPKLLADAMQLYSMVKPSLDAKSEAMMEKAKEHNAVNSEVKIDDEPIDLSSIPF
jgi:hypothetical protein